MSDTSVRKVPEAPRLPGGVHPGAGPYRDTLIARMRQKADLSQEEKLPRGPGRRAAVYRDLVDTAASSQAQALARLAELKAQGQVSSFESLYLPNAIVVHAAPGKWEPVSNALKAVADIEQVSQNKLWSLPVLPGADAARGAAEIASPRAGHPGTAASIEWGVQKVNAPLAWAHGYDGTGVTIGIVDTGLDSSHPAISAHYRGTRPDGTQVHDYNWFDPAEGRPAPYDDGQHGTHVAGTSAGGTSDRAIGVAPGARLIAAKAILGNGYNTTEATLKSLQFMLAPTDRSGANPDPARGADVINNSWGNADRSDRTFIDSWNGLLAAGTEMVAAAGNEGPSPGTVSPPGSFPQGISVAATGSSDKVAGFSSRGPSAIDPKAKVPLVAAPGSGVTSSVPGGRYSNFSGTSMAAPHVAGAVALLLQAKPTATHREIVEALTRTAVDIDAPGVDPAAGYGRIDVAQAIDYLLSHSPVPAPAPQASGR